MLLLITLTHALVVQLPTLRNRRNALMRMTVASSSNDRKGHLQSLASILLGAALSSPPPSLRQALAVGNDEYDVTFDVKQPLGLALEDFGNRDGKYRTYVSKTLRGSQATGKGIRIPALVVAVNGQNVEGLPRKMVAQLIRDTIEGRNGMGKGGVVTVTFRDPSKFMELLNDKTAAPGDEITTQLAPQTKARDAQTLAVKKTFVPEICQTGAMYGDLLEVKYTTSLADGTFLDATGVSTPGRGGDSTVYFVLGEQVAGTVPKGWDLALVGACVGEQRVIRTPSVLAYGNKGLKRRGIPPDATIIYNVEVIGINGNNLPR